MSRLQNASYVENLEEWNRSLSEQLIPNDVVLALYILLGIIGNTVVLYVYKLKINGHKTDRYFIPFLALADLLTSVVCGSMSISENLMQAKFNNTYLCKSFWFFAALTTYMSVLLLLIIAVQRYLKVVKPLGKQMDLKMNRISIALAFCLSFSLAVPTTLLYGSVPFQNRDNAVEGMRCSKEKDGNKIGSLIYSSVIGILALIIMGALIGLYSKIGWTIFRHIKNTQITVVSQDSNNSSAKPIQESSENVLTVSTSTATVDCEQISTLGQTHAATTHVPCVWDEEQRESSQSTTDVSSAKPDDVKDRKKPLKKLQPNTKIDLHNKINKKIMYKFSLMFMLITFIFLICYIPKVIIVTLESINPLFWEELDSSNRAAVLFVYRMFIINNITNPFVYAFFDMKFRNEMQRSCRCCM